MKNTLLTHEQTLELLRAAKEGDADAKQTLIEKNYALIKSIVKGFLNRGTEYDDLVQIGSMGFIKAIDGYDEKFGVKFSTYAVPMIAGEIKRFLRDDGMIKVSRNLKENAAKVLRSKENLKKTLLREPTIEEISADSGLSTEDIVLSLDAVRSPVSIYEPAFDDESSKTQLIDTVALDETSKMIDKLMVSQLLDKLDKREKQIILLRYFRDKTQSEISQIIGVSQVQVSRLLTKTIEKLKDAAKE